MFLDSVFRKLFEFSTNYCKLVSQLITLIAQRSVVLVMESETEPAKDARQAPHQLVIPTEAQLPQVARSFGPLVYWSEARPGTPSGLPRVANLVFRPTRTTLNELWTDVPRPVSDSPWQLSYALASRSECRLLQTIFEDRRNPGQGWRHGR